MSRPMAQDLADIFAERLAAAEADSAGLDQCLAQHPHDEAAWRELASLALELRQIPSQPPSVAFRSGGYGSLMMEIEQESSWRWRLRHILRALAPLSASRGPKTVPAWVSVFAAAILCLGTGGAVLASEDALPGDLLYGLKTTLEDIRLAVTPLEGDVSLHARFAERRISEMESLVAAGRLADVPQAVAGYETHVGQALRVLATAVDTDASTRERLATRLDQMLSEQTAELDALAGQVPAQMAPVIQQAQSVSTGAQNAIRQLRVEPDTGGTTDERSVAPTQEPAVAPSVDTPQAEPTRPEGQATSLPAEPPGLAPVRPLPGGTRPAPADDGSGEPRGIPDQPPPGTPAAAGAAPTRQDTPAAASTPVPTTEKGAASTPVPPAETRVAGTPALPPPPDGSPPGHPPASTPAAGKTPVPPAETRVAGTPAAPPPPDGSPPGHSPASTPATLPAPPGGLLPGPPPTGPPAAHADIQENTDATSPAGRTESIGNVSPPDGPVPDQPAPTRTQTEANKP
jgi:hypothetical protein